MELIRIVGEETKERGISKVKRISLVEGELASVMDESVQMYFEVLAENTPCAGATLTFEHVGAALRCSVCGHEFEHKKSFDCPICGGESLLIKGTGRELYIKSIDGE